MLLRLEGINLREFSNLTGIGYSTLGRYLNGERTPSIDTINQILAVPRFSRYRNLLTAFNEPIGEEPLSNTHAHEVREYSINTDPLVMEAMALIRRLQELGRGDEALAVLQAIEASAKKK